MRDPSVRPVSRLRPLRVLLAAGDRRFLRVSNALLDRCGYAITTCEKTSDVVAAVRRLRSDIVVLDPAPSLTAAIRVAAALEALDPPVGVVVAVEEPHALALPGVAAVSKWGPLQELVAAIESADRWRSARARKEIRVAR